MTNSIPFNRPYLTGNEMTFIQDAHIRGQLAGDGYYTSLCHQWLERKFSNSKSLLMHSGTAALELAALLIDLQPGDEVIMPSYTFVSTANAFVLRGGVPVFVDIRADTLNINEQLIEAAITDKTKAIVVVHYAGVGCEMKFIQDLARKYKIYLIEDAAQALMSTYDAKPLGSFGDISCFSFHETKNIICGEGGAVIINHTALAHRAEILREKGTNRSSFFRGEVSKYTWIDIGSSYLPGELSSAFLFAQLECAESITAQRLVLWNKYHCKLAGICEKFQITRPHIPSNVNHNGHIYYLVFKSKVLRDRFISEMRNYGVQCVFHYIPLHDSPGGLRFSRIGSCLEQTVRSSSSLVRLPLFIGLNIDYVVQAVHQSINDVCG